MNDGELESRLLKLSRVLPESLKTVEDLDVFLNSFSSKARFSWVPWASLMAVTAVTGIVLGVVLPAAVSKEPSKIVAGFGGGSGHSIPLPEQSVRVAYIGPREANSGEKAAFKIFAGRYDRRNEGSQEEDLIKTDHDYELRLFGFDYDSASLKNYAASSLLTPLKDFGSGLDDYQVTLSGGGCICEGEDCAEKCSFAHDPFDCKIDVGALEISYRYSDLVNGIGVYSIGIADASEETRLVPTEFLYFRKKGDSVTFLTFDEWHADYWEIMQKTN